MTHLLRSAPPDGEKERIMSNYYLFQDKKKRIGCHSCEVQCKSNKSLPAGSKLCHIMTIGPRFVVGLPKASYVFMPCFHCENPWCVAAYPTGAMQKRPQDGIVFVDHNPARGLQNLYHGMSVGSTHSGTLKSARSSNAITAWTALIKGLNPPVLRYAPRIAWNSGLRNPWGKSDGNVMRR